MSGTVRIELFNPVFFSRSVLPVAQLLFGFPEIMLWRVDPVDRAVVPNDITSAHVAVHPFLLSTFLAVDSSETCLDLHLFLFGLLFGSAPGAR